MVNLGIPSITLMQFPWLRWGLSGQHSVHALENPAVRLDAVAGWGRRTTAAYARRFARLRGLPFWTLEDGFYRSVGLGKARAPSFSFVLDRSGVYFDGRAPSDLETRLLQPIGPETAALGYALRRQIVGERLSKYNNVFYAPFELETLPGRRILLVDQVAGDQSLAGAGADAATFAAMWRDALLEAREGKAVLLGKAHPDVIAGFARGMLADAVAGAPLRWIDPTASIDAVLESIDEVWTVSSQLGFDALLRDRKVICYGAAFYAGWGLTEDRLGAASLQAQGALARRASSRPSVDAMTGIVAGKYPIYLDPVRRKPVDAATSLGRLADWRDQWFEHQGRVLAVGFAWHKRKLIRAHLGAAGKSTEFARVAPSKIDFGHFDEIVVWSDRLAATTVDAARTAGLRVTTVEDAFIRSKGLSHRKNLPLSLAFDGRAAHFDASRPSDLETILQTHAFPDTLLARADALRKIIIERGISKYNLTAEGPADLSSLATGRKILLVVAQVPGDASLRYGQPLHASNLAFLQAVRQAHPDCFIVFKDHPDLVGGLRPGRSDPEQLAPYCDLVVQSGDTTALFPLVDEVHVMTSLAGFEALMRQCKVVCHGVPFYSGWRLTTDLVTCSRRNRTLALNQLVAGALIVYPRYILPLDKIPCRAEDVVALFG